MEKFYITNNTQIIWDCNMTKVLKKAEERWRRDVAWTIYGKERGNNICISLDTSLNAEMFCWEIREEMLYIKAADELGILYAFLYISETYLGIKPFWFWNDQKFVKKEKIEICGRRYQSESFAVLYRGWSFQDAFLIDRWNIKNNTMYAWEMAMEALLRLGGNMIIAKMGKKNEKIYQLAKEMGFWIIQSQKEITYKNNPKVIWKLRPLEGILDFSKKEREKPEAIQKKETKNKKISIKQVNKAIKTQYYDIKEKTKQEMPITIIELYGALAQAYQNKKLDISKEVIKVWADNGYGKMVSKTKEKDKTRKINLPNMNIETAEEEKGGVYYHASICDGKAGSYLTMLPNSPELAADELIEAFARSADKFLLVNCSNIKPHVYLLDFIAKLWTYGTAEPNIDTQEYLKNYYPENWERVYGIFKSYHRYTLYYGKYKDEKAGEQFYHSMIRNLAYGWLKDNITNPQDTKNWAINKKNSLSEQVKWLEKTLLAGIQGLWLTYQKGYNLYEELTEKESKEKELFYDSIYLQTILHYFSAKGTLEFCHAFYACFEEQYPEAFVAIGKAIELFEIILDSIKKAEHDKWKEFYENDCGTDIKLTIYCLKNIRSFIRNIGEGSCFHRCKREFLNSEKTIYLKEEELYQSMRDKIYLTEKREKLYRNGKEKRRRKNGKDL